MPAVTAPLDDQKRRSVTSTVFPDPRQWYEVAVLISHEPMRRGLQEMLRVLEPEFFPGTAEQQWKVANFFRWYNRVFYPYMIHHHEVEARIVDSNQKSGVVAPAQGDLHNEHARLSEVLESIRSMERPFNEAMTSRDIQKRRMRAADELRYHVRELRALLLPHLAREEELAATVLADRFQSRDQARVPEKIFRCYPLMDLRWVVPSLYCTMSDFASPDECADFAGRVPLALRWLLGKAWMRKHAEYNVELLKSVALDEPPSASRAETPLLAA